MNIENVSVSNTLDAIDRISDKQAGSLPASQNYAPSEKNKSVRILFFGDMMLDRNVFNLSKKANDFAYPFAKIDPYLQSSGADITVANLEGPITSSSSVSSVSYSMRFTISPLFVPEIASRFSTVGIANNHIMDFGKDGFMETRKFLSDASVPFFGDYLNRGDELSTIVERNGVKVAFVGYHALVEKNLSNILTEVRRLHNFADVIIVMPHWGEEYDNLPSDSQNADAKALIDAGADMIVGSHPHVVQTIGGYKGVPVFFSLGNFIFDQYFSKDTMQGLAVSADIMKDSSGKISASYSLKPVDVGRDSRPVIMSDTDSSPILSAIADRSDVSEELKSAIEAGFISGENFKDTTAPADNTASSTTATSI